MQNCSKKFKLLISRDLDSDLSKQEKTILEQHFRDNKECERYRNDLLLLRKAMRFSLENTVQEKSKELLLQNEHISFRVNRKKYKINFVAKIVAIFVVILTIGILSTGIALSTKSYLAKKATTNYYYEPIDSFAQYVDSKDSYAGASNADSLYSPMEEYVLAVNY